MLPVQINLRAARANLGLTLKQAAQEFDIRPETLAKYEIDSSNIPRSFFIKIENVYGIPVDLIYFGRLDEFYRRMINRKFTLENA